MDMTLTAEEQAFRDDVRAWLKDGGLPGWLSDKVRGGKRLGKDDHVIVLERPDRLEVEKSV